MLLLFMYIITNVYIYMYIDFSYSRKTKNVTYLYNRLRVEQLALFLNREAMGTDRVHFTNQD